ncbi:MAG: AAA family ATPase [Candidatus Omnitrophota bacterium]
MSKTIAICNQKGGTGKTTSAINISAYFAMAQKKTLLIDMDPQGNATSGLGIDKNTLSDTIYQTLINQMPASQLIINTSVPNLSLIPSNIDLIGAEIELSQAENREFILQEAIKEIKDSFEFILIDCPPSLGFLTINALCAADSVLIPVQCEYYALEGLSQLFQTIERVRGTLRPELKIEGVVLTMADFRTNLTREVVQETRNFFKEKVYQTIIPRSIRLGEAPGFGKPIALYDQNSLGAKRYLDLSNEILGMEINISPENQGELEASETIDKET